MSLQILRIDNTYVAVDDNDENQIVLTPAGNEIRTRFPGLLREALEDIKLYGPDPTVAISVYNLVCSYIDFGRRTLQADLIDAILSDLQTDIVFDLPADPEAYRYLRACYDNELFNRLGISPL